MTFRALMLVGVLGVGVPGVAGDKVLAGLQVGAAIAAGADASLSAWRLRPGYRDTNPLIGRSRVKAALLPALVGVTGVVVSKVLARRHPKGARWVAGITLVASGVGAISNVR